MIAYLIVGIIFCVIGLVCGYFSYWTSVNKPDENQLMMKDWFSKWIIKNRMLIFIMLFVITIASGITLIVTYFK